VTPLLLLYRWTSNYGFSVARPLIYLVAAPFVWLVIYLKLYINLGSENHILTAEARIDALTSLAMYGSFPMANALTPMHEKSLQLLFTNDYKIPWQFQVAFTMQSVSTLIFIFLVGLALRNYFRLK
jgi:hypothetical protein